MSKEIRQAIARLEHARNEAKNAAVMVAALKDPEQREHAESQGGVRVNVWVRGNGSGTGANMIGITLPTNTAWTLLEERRVELEAEVKRIEGAIAAAEKILQA